MVITAVHLDAAGKPVRYRVENSWGDAAGQKGFMVMSDRYANRKLFSLSCLTRRSQTLLRFGCVFRWFEE